MEDYRNKSSGKRKRKMKGDVRRNYDASSFKDAYLKVVKDKRSVYKASKEYGIPWSTLKRHIANHGGENFDLSKLGGPFSLDRVPECKFVSYIIKMQELGFGLSVTDIKSKCYGPGVHYSQDVTKSFLRPFFSGMWLPFRMAGRIRLKQTDCNLTFQKYFVKSLLEINYFHFISFHVALRNGAEWVECMNCNKWYHQECTGTESPQFLCDNCDRGDFSGSDDSDWAPE